MAKLDLETKTTWMNALSSHSGPWILFGLDSQISPLSERLGGMAGLIDWYVHGQVSRLVSKENSDSDFFLIPSTSKEKPSFFFYHYSGSPELKKLSEKIKHLQISNIAVALSTFPEDFSKKLKQNLERDGIQWTKLEPDPK